jgi:hypothetical protein
MLGDEVIDQAGVDGSRKGLGLLDIKTTFSAEKVTRETEARVATALPTPWARLRGIAARGYEIRHGSSGMSERILEVLPDGLGFCLRVCARSLSTRPARMPRCRRGAFRGASDDIDRGDLRPARRGRRCLARTRSSRLPRRPQVTTFRDDLAARSEAMNADGRARVAVSSARARNRKVARRGTHVSWSGGKCDTPAEVRWQHERLPRLRTRTDRGES